MLDDGETLADLRARFPHVGEIAWLGVRPAARAPMQVLTSARLTAGHGIAGDHRASRAGSKRQVTLIQAEHLAAVAALLRRDRIDPMLLRRNLVVSGLCVLALKGARFRIGDALLEGTVACHPCSRMERELGPGGYNAMRGHGGLCAVVLEGGDVALGDAVRAVAD